MKLIIFLFLFFVEFSHAGTMDEEIEKASQALELNRGKDIRGLNIEIDSNKNNNSQCTCYAKQKDESRSVPPTSITTNRGKYESDKRAFCAKGSLVGNFKSCHDTRF